MALSDETGKLVILVCVLTWLDQCVFFSGKPVEWSITIEEVNGY